MGKTHFLTLPFLCEAHLSFISPGVEFYGCHLERSSFILVISRHSTSHDLTLNNHPENQGGTVKVEGGLIRLYLRQGFEHLSLFGRFGDGCAPSVLLPHPESGLLMSSPTVLG